MSTRNRQFNQTRTQNLTKNYSNISNTSSFNNSFRQAANITNKSFTSSFLKKPKPDVCVGCVNKKIANQKKTNQIKEKQHYKEQAKSQIEKMLSQKDPIKQQRQKARKEAKQYNRALIDSHKYLSKSEKQLDTKYLQQAIEKQQKILQQQRERIAKAKDDQLSYRKDLYLQLRQQQQKKKQQKLEKRKPQINQLKLSNYDKSKIIKEYSTDLKKQINFNKVKKQIEKQQQLAEQKKALSESQQMFLRYTQFANDHPSQMNPQVFEELKLIDYTKKNQKLQNRQKNYKQRSEELQIEKQLQKKESERIMSRKSSYYSDLKSQMNEKKLKAAAQRQEKLRFSEKELKFTEDIVRQSRVIKPCEECNHEYQQKCLI